MDKLVELVVRGGCHEQGYPIYLTIIFKTHNKLGRFSRRLFPKNENFLGLKFYLVRGGSAPTLIENRLWKLR